MNHRIVPFILCLALLIVPRAIAAQPEAAGAQTGRAPELVSALREGRFQDVVATFDDVMRQRLPAERIAAAWTAVGAQLGPLRGVGELRQKGSGDGYRVVTADAEWERGTIEIRITLAPDGRVSGLFLAPKTVAAAPSPPPAYADSTTFTEQAVTVGAAGWPLPGTLALPRGAGPFPAVVLVHGSGPLDRDETVGGTRVFRDLAWGLASRGIAVLRYEKRTRALPQQVARLADSLTTWHETSDDAVAALAALRRAPGVDGRRVFVLGHSLGGMLAPRIARADGRVAGLILMAAPTRPLEDLVVEQVEYLTSRDDPRAAQVRAQAARVKGSLSPAPPADSLLLGVPASYWLELRGYRPVDAALRLRKPLLVLQGGRDYQVPAADHAAWARSLPASSFRLYPALNHLFVAGTGPSKPDEYARPGHVDAAVVTDIAGWIRRVAPGGRE